MKKDDEIGFGAILKNARKTPEEQEEGEAAGNKDADKNLEKKSSAKVKSEQRNLKEILKTEKPKTKQKKKKPITTTAKREYVMTYFNGNNYDQFEDFYIKIKRHIRHSMDIKLAETHVAELAIMIAVDMFKSNKENFFKLAEEYLSEKKEN